MRRTIAGLVSSLCIACASPETPEYMPSYDGLSSEAVIGLYLANKGNPAECTDFTIQQDTFYTYVGTPPLFHDSVKRPEDRYQLPRGVTLEDVAQAIKDGNC